MRTEVGFDAEFDSERFFSWIYCQKKVSLRLIDSFKDFLSVCTNNKSELGFMTHTGLTGEAIQSVSWYDRL